jgi:hypothetical protein
LSIVVSALAACCRVPPVYVLKVVIVSSLLGASVVVFWKW